MKGFAGLVSAAVFSLALAGVAQAEPAIYEIPTAGVVCGGTAAQAEAAVRRAGDVQSVSADPATHKVVARFDDEQTDVDAIVRALEGSGLKPGEPKRIKN